MLGLNMIDHLLNRVELEVLALASMIVCRKAGWLGQPTKVVSRQEVDDEYLLLEIILPFVRIIIDTMGLPKSIIVMQKIFEIIFRAQVHGDVLFLQTHEYG